VQHNPKSRGYVRTPKAAERVKRSVSRFITGTLKLVVNEEKIEVSRPWHSKCLGFRITRYMGKTRTGIHARSLQKFRRKVREITARERGLDLTSIVGELNSYPSPQPHGPRRRPSLGGGGGQHPHPPPPRLWRDKRVLGA
jgi:hypothetical protein